MICIYYANIWNVIKIIVIFNILLCYLLICSSSAVLTIIFKNVGQKQPPSLIFSSEELVLNSFFSFLTFAEKSIF